MKQLVPLTGTLAMLAACATPPAPPVSAVPPPESYTAATTHAKLVRQYPFIRIAGTDVPAGVEAVRDVTYGRHGGRALKLDLYLPVQRQGRRLPGIVFVHGGGWRVGVRDNFAPMAIRMAQRGYVAATISYRLADEAPYPAAVHDARAAVRWMRAHAGDHAIDPGRIALAGGSAGGQVASLAGVTRGMARFDADVTASPVSSEVQAIVNLDGLSDFAGEVARLRGQPAQRQPAAWQDWFGGWFRAPNAALPALWREASPLTYAAKDTPPVLYIVSGVPRYSVGAHEMMGRLQAAGVPSDMLTMADVPHSFWLFDPWLAPAVDATVAFLDAHMAGHAP